MKEMNDIVGQCTLVLASLPSAPMEEKVLVNYLTQSKIDPSSLASLPPAEALRPLLARVQECSATLRLWEAYPDNPFTLPPLLACMAWIALNAKPLQDYFAALCYIPDTRPFLSSDGEPPQPIPALAGRLRSLPPATPLAQLAGKVSAQLDTLCDKASGNKNIRSGQEFDIQKNFQDRVSRAKARLAAQLADERQALLEHLADDKAVLARMRSNANNNLRNNHFGLLFLQSKDPFSFPTELRRLSGGQQQRQLEEFFEMKAQLAWLDEQGLAKNKEPRHTQEPPKLDPVREKVARNADKEGFIRYENGRLIRLSLNKVERDYLLDKLMYGDFIVVGDDGKRHWRKSCNYVYDRPAIQALAADPKAGLTRSDPKKVPHDYAKIDALFSALRFNEQTRQWEEIPKEK